MIEGLFEITSTAAGMCIPLLGISHEEENTGPDIPESLVDTYTAYLNSLETKSAEKVIPYFAPDAVVLINSQSVFRLRDEIRSGYLEPPLNVISCDPIFPTVNQAIVGDKVVTFVGRYGSKQPEANDFDGIYSNTWHLQDDGKWKMKASLTTFES